jgi:hypothetical protein
MKKIFLTAFALIAGIFIHTQSLTAQVIVKVRPVAPRVVAVRPPMRGRGMVWIEPEWYWNRHQKMYVWREGRWVKPRRQAAWVPGHLVEVSGGHNWVPGYWGRRK